MAVSDREDAFLFCGGGSRGCGLWLFHVNEGILHGNSSDGGDCCGVRRFETFTATGILCR